MSKTTTNHRLGNRLQFDRQAAGQVGGLHYLLVTEAGAHDYVLRYLEAEMTDVFSPAQRAELEAGRPVLIGQVRFIDMVTAARKVTDRHPA